MQFRQDSRGTLRRKIGLLMRRNSFITGTVLASPAPSSTTFALTSAKMFGADHFKGNVIYAVSGTGAGQSAFCSASAIGTGVLTVSPALSPVFDSTTVVECWPDEITPDAVNNAINLALDDLEDILNVYVETASPTLNTARDVVTIPTAYVKLCIVRYLDAGGTWRVYRYCHSPELFREEQGKGFTFMGRSVYLSQPIPSDIAGTDILITGYSLPAQLNADTDLAQCPAPFLVYKAAALLEQSLTGNVDIDSEGHASRGSQWLAQAQQLRPAMPYQHYLPNTIVLEV